MKHFTLEETTPIVADGMVLYCDGSARPNPGFIGAGIHGYAYKTDKPTKGTGLGTHSLTSEGYVDNKENPMEKPLAITPVLYYNTAASFAFHSTNNVAEMLAAHIAIRMALACNIKRLLIKTDSEYVVKVLTKFAAIWIKSNWTKRDGTQVSNIEFIKDTLEAISEVQRRGIKLEFQWVKGHSTHTGNNIADKLANIGAESSKQRLVSVNVQEQKPEGYWKQDSTRHPFLSHVRAYVSTLPTALPSGTYYLGDHGKEDEFVGRAEVAGALTVAILKDSEATLDTITDYCKKVSGDDTRFFFVKLDAVYAHNRDKDISIFKEGSLIIAEKAPRLDISSGDNTLLVRDLQPIRLAERTFIALADLHVKLLDFNNGVLQKQSVETDITHLFYDSITKIVKNKETITTELLKKYVVGYRSEKVKIKHHLGESSVILTLGVDIPDRNALKRLESLIDTMKILSWMESATCVKHACIITTKQGDSSIWCAYYSNRLYVE